MFSEKENCLGEESTDFETLGTIYGVADLHRTAAAEQLVGTPVLMAENAFVFFAWQEESIC